MKLKTKLSKLRHDGHITDAEYSIIINVLNKFSTQPPKPKVVSRDATNEGCWKEEEEYSYGLKSKRIWLEPIQALEQQPKIGHWIAMGEGFTPYECSECEAAEFKKSKYCPNCGAKMTESEE